MTLATWITLIAAIGGPAGVVALIMVLPQIKKLQADTERVERDSELADIDGAARLSSASLAQMDAAVARATRAEAHADRLEEQITKLHLRVAEVEASLRAYHRIAQDHAGWDRARMEELVARGLALHEIPPPPPLLPPPADQIT